MKEYGGCPSLRVISTLSDIVMHNTQQPTVTLWEFFCEVCVLLVNSPCAQGKKVVVFYGSQTGTAEEFANRLAKDARRHGMPALAFDPEECTDWVCVLVSASYVFAFSHFALCVPKWKVFHSYMLQVFNSNAVVLHMKGGGRD